MAKISYVAAGFFCAALGLAHYVQPVFADAPVKPKIETKVSQPLSGLESRLEQDKLNNGLYNGRYRAEGEMVIQSRNAVPGPLVLNYSLCFLNEDGRSGCKDGKREQFPEGLPQGELRRAFSFKERYKDNAPRQGKPKISVHLQRLSDLKFIYDADHFIPASATYQCKDGCPAD